MKNGLPMGRIGNPSLGLASYTRAHAHAQYGLVRTNYAMPEAVSYAVCPKSYRTPNVIAIFVKGFSK
jgi:hypothetical protein